MRIEQRKKIRVFESELSLNQKAFNLEGEEEDKELHLSIPEYDERIIMNKIKQSVLVFCLITGVHYYFNVSLPLIGVSLLAFYRLCQEPIIKP
eukprot:UN10894